MLKYLYHNSVLNRQKQKTEKTHTRLIPTNFNKRYRQKYRPSTNITNTTTPNQDMFFGRLFTDAFQEYFVNVLFKDIVIINKQAVPKKGPVIIYGNHNNQFVDGMNLREVTTIAKTFDSLSTLFTCRELYQVKVNKELTWKEKVDLNRRFAKGFDKLFSESDKHPQIKKLYDQIKQFDQLSRTNMLPIKTLPKKHGIFHDFFAFAWYLAKTVTRVTLLIPSVLLIGPTAAIISHLSERERIKCLKSSKVKVHGNDVVGSYKVLLTLTIFPITSAINCLGLYFLLNKYTTLGASKSKTIAVANYLLFPFYTLFMLKAYDSLMRTFQKLKFYFLRLLNRNTYDDYNRKRKFLAERVREAVDRYGELVFTNFDEHRIIKKDEFENLVSEVELGEPYSGAKIEQQQSE